MSIYSLISSASILVQIVMALLLLASVVSWVFIIRRAQILSRAKSEATIFEEQFWSGVDLNTLYKEGNARTVDGVEIYGLEGIFRAGFKEFSRLSLQVGADAEAIMTGAQRAMRVAATKEEEMLETNLPFLATVASASPYVGLFGTVWGIMNSFRGLANVHQATLSVVAPGIAEALIATAMGLFAAIPAVIAYNHFAAKVESLVTGYDTFAEEFASILHRQAYLNARKTETDQRG
ncbi:MAG: protein TolQ [Pseudomonadales bacterium]|nr:protein TolQ [Pseudomonadales bacterium]